MQIVADENIPLLDEFFAGFGEIRRLPGRSIDAASVADADVLLVRSVTQVSRALLQSSPVKFVGTCTIGTDHLDIPYLAEAGVTWSSAPGCNARGVVDYVLGSLVVLAERQAANLAARTYGVIGAGQVGGRLVKVLKGLGWRVLVCDPLREAAEGGDFVSLQQVLESCDVISLHTPLEKAGAHPTHHLLNAERLAALKPGCWLINSSRGPVVDNQALLALLNKRTDLRVVLDVWEGEPQANVELAALCQIATPHIAGYSLDGKLRGTEQIYQAYCRAAGLEVSIDLQSLMPAPWLHELVLDVATPQDWALSGICRAVYDPRQDDANFRRSLTGDSATRRAAFDALRKQYPVRREIEGLQVRLKGEAEHQALAEMISALGAVLVRG
ncbi:4-phosphoerythronate dehydrogenase PdxB [Pseudomonas sp. TTU2014-080ASC]|uniref:4-phosphoerythronate dehydrogenase PdxB n=1 Tax=Pseudomonas sp. TTU2014-080ASC TaxID=1729724 RepID=UPI000718A84C|nr:4-phosphoerythronate dehydrogenase PdxB [Pseudomonas sp. TTU2014-080ASC]KRW59767.1 erythronate-4-phosphate dehydrogenase [Pseudomonas sp. TTU2014-080ASC]